MSDKRYTIYGNSNDLDGIQEAIDLVVENERLNNIIDKAIEYIDIHAYSNVTNNYDELYNGQIEDLVKILKGDDIDD